ncbi:hypothetical protein KP509_33G026800 [Ceratopteris richardii]|nr:hypothetical protein KP509_33G026800 [Ceratopteris richardii]
MQAQKASSMGEIVILKETTAHSDSRFASETTVSALHRELKEAFTRFDANGDGKISPLELGSVLRSLGDNPSEEDILLMVEEVDQDGDGFIDLQEFLLLNADTCSSKPEDLREAFMVFDANADGKISVEELHHVLSRLGEVCTLEECGRMIRGVDADGDGFVDFQEFCHMMSME